MHRLFLALASLFVAASANAATLADASGDCTWRLSGQIVADDADRVAALLPAFDETKTRAGTLCLDSPGGVLTEAVAIGRLLVERAVSTRLEQGAECLSACAVAFMMGTQYERPVASGGNYERALDGRYPSRVMHVSARLGFHRPSLGLPEGTSYAPEAVIRAFDVATDAALELTVLSADGRIDVDLMREMFAHRGQNFFYIDTVGKALRWNIGLLDAARPAILDRRAAWEMCNNLVYSERLYAPPRPFRPERVEIVSTTPKLLHKVQGADSDPYSHDCFIRQATEMGPGLVQVCGYYGPSLEAIGEYRCNGLRDRTGFDEMGETFFSTLNGFAADVPLGDLASEAAAIEARAADDLAEGRDYGRDAFRQRCPRVQGFAYVRGVQNFATLRAAPNLGAPVVAELPLGARVQEPNLYDPSQPSERVAFNPGTSRRCTELCVYDSGPANSDPDVVARQQCYEDLSYWYKVRGPSGRDGWVNGKFLRY